MGKILKWPILYIAVQLGIVFLCTFLFIGFGYNIEETTVILGKYKIVLAILLGCIFIPLLIRDYRKEKRKTEKLTLNNIVLIVLIGVTLSIIYNTLVYYLNQTFHFTNLYSSDNQIITNLISVGIIGPIIEEYMFRGVIYDACQKRYNNMKSILICTALFTVMHFTIVQMIYAFALGFILIYVYLKCKNIKAAIWLHMTSNITTTLWSIVLLKNNFTLNYIVYLVFLIILIITFVRLKKIWYNSSR